MRKRYSLNLHWSEHARRRRAILMVGGLAVGGFVVGIIFSVVTDFLRPASNREGAVIAVGHIPIFATPAPFTAAEPVEPASPSWSRPSIADVIPPRNGTLALTPPVGTDGRGGATDGRGGSAVVSPKEMARAKASEDRLQKIMQICRGC
jgi:hypothetical protein